MVFAQLTYRESLRDIEACLRSLGGKLYHMGFRSKIAKPTLADANAIRDWRIYADFAQVLIAIFMGRCLPWRGRKCRRQLQPPVAQRQQADEGPSESDVERCCQN